MRLLYVLVEAVTLLSTAGWVGATQKQVLCFWWKNGRDREGTKKSHYMVSTVVELELLEQRAVRAL